MSKYFAKYLPVEGEIREGDVFLDDELGPCVRLEEGTQSTWISWKGGQTNLHIDLNVHKKAKLFLCSRDIKVGDEIMYQSYPDFIGKVFGKVTKIDKEPFYQYWNEENKWIDYKEGFKIIGEISKEATWVKEGDEFEEEELQLVVKNWQPTGCLLDPGKVRGINGEIQYIKIKGPCGHFH